MDKKARECFSIHSTVMLSADLESLPQELKDLIVDHIAHFPDEAERKQSLRATALVSKRFRYWAHKRLFSTVILRGKYGKAPISRLRELRDLIAADPFSDKTGVASHIRSFTFSLGEHRSCVAPPLEDDALPFILRKIHRSGSRPRSLSILLFMPGDNDQLDWISLNPAFRSALLDVSRSPLLTTLRLRGFRNLPPDILAGSSVENIKFNNLSIQDDSYDQDCGPYAKEDFFWNVPLQLSQPTHQVPRIDPPRNLAIAITTHSPRSVRSPSAGSDTSDLYFYPDYIHLESIEIDHTFPILHILDLSPARSYPPTFIFQKLKNLTVNIKQDGAFKEAAEIFDNAPFVEKLEIKLNCTGIPTDALSLQSLGQLKHLRLIHRFSTPGINNVPTHTTIRDIVALLTNSRIPKTLRRISITLLLKPPSFYCSQHAVGEEEEFAPLNGGGSTGDLAERHSSLPDCKIPPTTILVKRFFAECSKVFKPLDDLLGCPSSLPTETPDRFAHVNYYTIRLEVDLHAVPKGFTKQKEKEFADEAGVYIKSEFFPRLNERFEKVDEVTLEKRLGGFGVVVTPRSRTS